jgi:protein-tyrosine-phosphatase
VNGAGHSTSMPSAALFACNRNTVRSPMAAALARHYLGGRIHIDSAGVEAGEPDPFVAAVLAEIGIEIDPGPPKSFEALAERDFDLVITLAPEAHHRALDLAHEKSIEVEYWPTQDPTVALEMGLSREGILAAYREVREALTARILARFGPNALGHL